MSYDAYYYSFEPTGNDAVDMILQAVAAAGKGCHHTEDWSEYGLDKGIQDAANNAATLLSASATPSPDPPAPTPAAAEGQAEAEEWTRKAIAETRTAASLLNQGEFRGGMETACDEIETRMDGDTLLTVAEGQAERIIEVLTAERDQARAQYDHVFRVMMSVYGLAPSGQNIQLEDGRVMWFKDPNAAETLHMLGRAIHEIPKKLAEAAQVGGVQAPSAPDDDSLGQFYPPKAALKREDWDTATRKPKPAAPLPRQAAVQTHDAKEIAISVAHEVLHHIDSMYPEMWKPVVKLARTSIRNLIIGQSQRFVAKINDDNAIEAARYRYIEDHASTDGGGSGFMIRCFVPVDHEDMGCGLDEAIATMATAPDQAKSAPGEPGQ